MGDNEMTLNEIRKEMIRLQSRYELNGSSDPMATNSICVGGLFCEALGYLASRFPTFPLLAKALQEQNSNLSPEKAREFAIKLIIANDKSQFPQAFKILYKALRYVGSTLTAQSTEGE